MEHKGYYYNLDKGIEGTYSKRLVEFKSTSSDTLVLGMGGTIMTFVNNLGSGSSLSNLMSPEFAEILKGCEYKCIKLKLSEDLTEEDIFEVDSLIRSVKHTKIIILHGTDTLLRTANYIDLLPIDKCVIFVGSQKSPDKPSSEANLLLDAAMNFNKKGVYVALYNGGYPIFENPAFLNKVSTYRRDTFIKRPGSNPLMLKERKLRPARIMHYMDKLDSRPTVIIGTGLGNIPSSLFNEINSEVFITSESLIGMLSPHVYSNSLKLKEYVRNENLYRLYWYLRCSG